MKKIFLFIPLAFVILVHCSGMPEQKTVDEHHQYMEIALSFNTESYPWLLGTKYPQLSVWIETDIGDHETVFVTLGAGKNKWMFADERPGALPVWTGIRPEKQDMEIDAVSGATPSGETHSIVWKIPAKYNGKRLSVFIEANVSFDYNEFYTKEENTPGYSGVNGQPSVVWKSSFIADDNPEQVTPEIIGYGHVLGKNSSVDSDMSGITTAAELFNYLNVIYHPDN